jgi:predicted nucleotidyltransferase
MLSNARLSANHCVCVIEALTPFCPAVIYLFGSFGTSSQHSQSDIDIAFLPTLAADPLACFHLANHLADRLGRSVDLVNLNQASTVLAKEVLRTGVPVDIANPARQQQFEMLTLADYARLNEERQPILAS